jgi:hypothetical protein
MRTLYIFSEGREIARVCGVVEVQTFKVWESSPYGTEFGHHVWGENEHGKLYLGGLSYNTDWRLS